MLEFLTLQEDVFYLPNNSEVGVGFGPSIPFYYGWNGLWSHFAAHCGGLQSCLSSLLGLVTHWARMSPHPATPPASPAS